MKIRAHVWVAGRCIMCDVVSWLTLRNAAIHAMKGDPGPVDERLCVEREDYIRALGPVPARRQIACEDQDAIAARIADLRRERTEAMNRVTA